jgi:hypothetical protein
MNKKSKRVHTRVCRSSKELDNSTEKGKKVTEHFTRGILTRREAAEPGQDLPPGATHSIVKSDDGSTRVERERYSAF